MLRTRYKRNLIGYTPEIALTTVDLPWATCPTVPMLRIACRLITCLESAVKLGMSS